VTFPDAIKSGFSNYVVFQGRVSRSAFWYWQVLVLVGGLVAVLLDRFLFAMSGCGFMGVAL
tara:strand:- start:1873 stop:2055 length:183 start_codon:yes stop_codon:yes gene_type:complete